MLSILIVSWNVRELLRQCLLSLARYPATHSAQEIIVVDNASQDGSVDMLQVEFPHVQVITNSVNRGFTGGNNDGLKSVGRKAMGDGRWAWGEEDLTPHALRSSPYVLLLNPDAEVTPGALDALLDYAQAHPDVGLIGPQLRYPDGTVQSSRRRFPTLLTGLFESTWLQSVAPGHSMDHYYMRDQADTQTQDVDWVVGAAMFVRQEVITQVGVLDEDRFFMYSEETDWCKRIKDAGWRVVYHPTSVIVHHEGQSSKQISSRRMLLFNTSKVRYFAKHHGKVTAQIVRIGLLAQFAWQMALENGKWLLGNQRPMRQERMQAYWTVIRSGLR